MKFKLLNRTLQFYILFSIAVILITAPVFYFSITRLFIHEADEVLSLHKLRFTHSNFDKFTDAEILFWNRTNRDSKILPYDPKLKKDRKKNEIVKDSLDHEEVPYRVLRSPVHINGKPKVFMARVSMIETDALVENIAWLFCIILAVLLTGLFFITKILSGYLWKPFFSTIDTLERFELDKNSVPVFTDTRIDEFDRLNMATKKLLEKNISVFRSQKEFIENAAHELQTPMALFLAKLDVLVQQVPITPELSDSLTSLHDSAARIIRLNKNLLLLSKIENDQFAALDNVDVNEVVERHTDFVSQQLREKELSLNTDLKEAVHLVANAALLEVAISNLLMNALRHNIRHGVIEISLSAASISVSNSGIAALPDPKLLFGRFSMPSVGGTGLGLSITQKICDQHHWKLLYWFETGKHTFKIIFDDRGASHP